MRALSISLFVLLLPLPALAQAPAPRPADVASIDAIVAALYSAVRREPGEPFPWDRMRPLFLPGATLIPNLEQTGGVSRVMSVEEFIAWGDSVAGPGGPDDRGFVEEEVAHVTERYGDIAHRFSTYQVRFWDDTTVLGHGINSLQLLYRDGRWWVVSLIWDDESGAGPIPARYRAGSGER